jgi:hypothetical protein
MQHIQAGRLRAIAITGDKRLANFTDKDGVFYGDANTNTTRWSLLDGDEAGLTVPVLGSKNPGGIEVYIGPSYEENALMLAEAKIDSELLESLASGMRNLGENAKSLEGITSAVSATDSYVSSLQKASDKVSSLSDAYEKASLSISGITSDAQSGESFGEQMIKVSQNLAALNNVYELQLKGSSAHLESTQKFQSQVTEMMKNLSDSAEDTRLYKENMSVLTRNLSDLNNVYGNMLKAMNVNR